MANNYYGFIILPNGEKIELSPNYDSHEESELDMLYLLGITKRITYDQMVYLRQNVGRNYNCFLMANEGIISFINTGYTKFEGILQIYIPSDNKYITQNQIDTINDNYELINRFRNHEIVYCKKIIYASSKHEFDYLYNADCTIRKHNQIFNELDRMKQKMETTNGTKRVKIISKRKY